MKKEQQTPLKEQAHSKVKDSEVVGEQFTEEAYIEADVIGFDGSIDEKPSEKPSLKRKSMDETDHYRYDVRKEQIHSSQQYGSSSLNSRGDVKRQIPEQTRSSQQYGSSSQNSKGDVNRQIPKNQEIQKAGGEQKVEKKEAFVEDKFGLVRVGNKRLVNIDSLILPQEKKHGGRSRLFVANLASGVTENDLKELFEQFGDVSEVFVNKEKGFGFVRLDYKVNADIAKNALDGFLYKSRQLKVKFAAHQSAIEIHGIDQFTSNESLEAAFSQFGFVERATVVCDERGRSKGYAIVEFAFKKAAQTALHRINTELFVLGRLPKPVTAKQLSQTNDEGVHEKDLERIPGIGKDREYKARFVHSGSPEYAMAKRWRELEEEGRAQKERLERQLEEDQHKMEYDFEANMHDQEAEYIRQELLQKQAAIEEEIRRYDEMRNRESMAIRQHGKSFDNRHSNRRQSDNKEMPFRGMPNSNVSMGQIGLSPAAALALAANSSIMKAIKGSNDAMGGSNQGMQRMQGPRGGPMGHPARGQGMMGGDSMPPPRPLFDDSPHGNSIAGTRRPGSRENMYASKRPRT